MGHKGAQPCISIYEFCLHMIKMIVLNFSSSSHFLCIYKSFCKAKEDWLSLHKSWPFSSPKNYKEVLLLLSLFLLARFLSGTRFPIINCYLIQMLEIIAVCLISGPKTAGKTYIMTRVFCITSWFSKDNLTMNVWDFFLFGIHTKGMTVHILCDI